MSPISTIPASLAFAFMLTVSCWSSNASEKPNVIIVMTDDQGYGDLSCHGNPIIKTPHLDALHAESVRFTDFHVSPFCTPTRNSWGQVNYLKFALAKKCSKDQFS